jgi:hypothetical protein
MLNAITGELDQGQVDISMRGHNLPVALGREEPPLIAPDPPGLSGLCLELPA